MPRNQNYPRRCYREPNRTAGLRSGKNWIRLVVAVLVSLSGPLRSISAAPPVVYVDSTYPNAPASVNFPNNGLPGPYTVGLDAFGTIQAGVNHVADMGTVNVAAGTYAENVSISTRLSLVGPNAGKAGTNLTRVAEARVIPAVNDPENTGILSVETNNITIDGFLLDGNNPALGVGYPGNGPRSYAAAGVQNGVVNSYLLDISDIRVQNTIIRNVSYDGIYLDRADYPATTTVGNYILNNKFENMYEGVSTYNLHSVIACNTFTNLNHGIAIHVVTNAAPGFTPVIASNILTIAQWWPPNVVHAPGIWVNYRNGAAPSLDVKWNVIDTPTPIPPQNSIFALYALSVNGSSKVNFINNAVNGSGICTEGLFVTACTGDNVNLLGGSLNNILNEGVLADTVDPNWGPGDAFVTISNVNITLSTSSSVGVLAFQENSTPNNSAGVTVLGNTSITGGAAGVDIQGTNATAIVKNNTATITANAVGIHVNGGKALIENNNLVGNSTAGILVENDGAVDAGNCWATNNITGLGISAGLNILAGYGFDGFTPWAIKNLGSKTVYAQNNTYGATPNDSLAAGFLGAVIYSQNGGTPISCPPAIVVQTLSQVPVPDNTMPAFLADGGSAANAAGTLSSSDNILTNSPGNYLVTRTYRLTDICGQVSSCAQSIAVQPLISFIGYVGGHPYLSINGQPGHGYSIQASTNFVNWINLVTNIAPYAYTDTSSNGSPYRFYRAQILP